MGYLILSAMLLTLIFAFVLALVYKKDANSETPQKILDAIQDTIQIIKTYMEERSKNEKEKDPAQK